VRLIRSIFGKEKIIAKTLGFGGFLGDNFFVEEGVGSRADAVEDESPGDGGGRDIDDVVASVRLCTRISG